MNTRPTPSSDVRPLDLANLLKHAFSAGNASATADRAWTDYDPTDCAAYARIAAALSRLSALPAQVEVTDEMVRLAHAEYHKVLGDKNRSDPMRAALTAALTATDAKQVVPAKPVAGWRLLNDVRMFIEREYADPSAAPNGEWLAKEARLIHDRICRALANFHSAPPSPVEGEVERALRQLLSSLEKYADAPSDRISDEVFHFVVVPAMRSARAALASEGKTDA